jgi:hypothetical protein
VSNIPSHQPLPRKHPSAALMNTPSRPDRMNSLVLMWFVSGLTLASVYYFLNISLHLFFLTISLSLSLPLSYFSLIIISSLIYLFFSGSNASINILKPLISFPFIYPSVFLSSFCYRSFMAAYTIGSSHCLCFFLSIKSEKNRRKKKNDNLKAASRSEDSPSY